MDISHRKRLKPSTDCRNRCGKDAFSSAKECGSSIMSMFNKCFYYQNHELNPWTLPSVDVIYSEYYQLENLQQIKVRLNDVKSKLNDYNINDWSNHTRRKDPAGEIPWRLKSEIKAEFVTVGWCKFFECLNRFPALAKDPRINSLHLCEAPGAFIAALNHYLHSTYDKNDIEWNWLATTLNPYYEGNRIKKMIMDDRFMLYTLNNWLFHKDFTGNIINKDNLEHMKEQCQQRLGDVHLITADGSIDCIDSPDCQEENVSLLHFTEIVSALEILADCGSFVVKMFTLFEAASISILYLLNCAFREVHVFKPCTSKRGNSEVYVICLNYQKNIKNLKDILLKMKEKVYADSTVTCPLFPKSHLPRDFLMQHEIMCRLFMNYQINAIESNIFTFEIKPYKSAIKRLQVLRTSVCDEYFTRYRVRKIRESSKILYKYHAYIYKNYMTQIYQGSYSEREMLKETTKEEQVFYFRKELNDLERKLKSPTAANDELVCKFQRTSNEDSSPVQLTLYHGKRLETLHSTLFANVLLVVMRSKLNHLHNGDVLSQNNPHIVFPQNDYALKFNDFTAVNFGQQQTAFFKTFIEKLIEYKPAVIKFINIPFLSHYAASILRYLSLSAYDHLTFTFHPSFEIVLESITSEFNRSLDDLYNALCSCSSSTSELDVLCFINIVQLHHNEFNVTLTSYNNMLLLQNFKSILD